MRLREKGIKGNEGDGWKWLSLWDFRRGGGNGIRGFQVLPTPFFDED